LWAEWNGKYRDQVRSFWRGDSVGVGELAFRLTGSSDLYQHNGRRPYASINFITSHDGFTLNDLVTYNNKHNQANGENNRDGDNHNLSWNCGVEGPTDHLQIAKLREQQKRNVLATLLLSQGVPMLCGGDERGRTQRGNNNAYCQDNEISWLDWNLRGRDEQLLRFTQRLIRLRQEHPVLHRRTFFQGRAIRDEQTHDIVWYEPSGTLMTNEQWNNGQLKALGMLLNGLAIDEVDEWGEHLVDDMLLLLINGHAEPVRFKLPGAKAGPAWHVLLDTSSDQLEPTATARPGASFALPARSVVLLCQPRESV
jgi:glycogen operon protein